MNRGATSWILLLVGPLALMGCEASPRSPAAPEDAVDRVAESASDVPRSKPVSAHPLSAPPRRHSWWPYIVTREVRHTKGRHDPVRSLPPLVSEMPAPHPRDPRPFYARVWGFSHGVKTEVQPLLKTTTRDDGFPFFVSWQAQADNEEIPPGAIDLVATLSAARFELLSKSGALHQLHASSSDEVFGAFRLLMVLTEKGLELREGSVEGSPWVKPTKPLFLPWVEGTQSLREPGPWRVRITGDLHIFGGDSLPYESGWMEFQLEPHDAGIPSLETTAADAARWLNAEPGDGAPAKLREVLGENSAGNRVVVFDRGPGAREWSIATTLVEQDRSSKVVGLWSSERDTCIAEGATVSTRRGDVPIERVRVGDEVLSYDTLSGARVWSKVEGVRRGVADRVLVVDDHLALTEQHPIWIGGRWMKAGALEPGMELMTDHGTPVAVTSVERRKGAVRVYDLSVEAPHNYFANGVLVHNKSMVFPWVHAWRYDHRMVRPEDLLDVVKTTREPIMQCYANDKTYGERGLGALVSFEIELSSGNPTLLSHTLDRGSSRGRVAATEDIVAQCISDAFQALKPTHAFPTALVPTHYRFWDEQGNGGVEAIPDPTERRPHRLGEPYEKPRIRRRRALVGNGLGGPRLCEVEGSWAPPIFAEPGPELSCEPPCDEIRECGFVGWVPSGMSFDCPGEIYVATTSHEDRRHRPVLPRGFPVRIHIVENEGGRWLTIRAGERRDGYVQGELLLAFGEGDTPVPPGRPSFLAPLRVELTGSAQRPGIELRDRSQWTQMKRSADCYSADGRYFFAFAARHRAPPRFLVLNSAHGEAR